MTDGAVRLTGTIVEVEDHYGTCEVEIDSEQSTGGGRIWLPIPDVVDDPSDIPGYVGRRVSVTVAMMGEGGFGMTELMEMADEMTAVGGIALYIRDWVRDGYPKERIAEELEGISTWCGESAERLREIAGEGDFHDGGVEAR